MPGPARRRADRALPNVATFGNFTIDTVTYKGRSATAVLGGDCVYAAVGARIWGASVRAVGVIGNDYPLPWLRQLDAGGVDTRCVRRLSANHGLVAPMNYDEHQRRENERPELLRERKDWKERWRLFSPTPQDAQDCLAWANCVHLAAMPVERQSALLEYFHGTKDVITVDLPWSPDVMRPLELPPVEWASAVFLSDAELQGHFDGMGEGESVQRLFERGAKVVVIKHGKQGSTLYRQGDRRGVRVPAYVTEVVDPTGAGDAYCGGFAVGYWLTGEPLPAALYGTVSASFVIEGFSAGHALTLESQHAHQRLVSLEQQVEAIP